MTLPYSLVRVIGVVALAILLLVAAARFFYVSMEYPDETDLSGAMLKAALELDALKRTYTVYVPANLPKSAPLVIALHGSDVSRKAARLAVGYRFDTLADEQGFVVAYPDRFENHWSGCLLAEPNSAVTQTMHDVNFLRALRSRLISEYQLDKDKVLVTDLSLGGFMVLRLALHSPGTFASMHPSSETCPIATVWTAMRRGTLYPFPT
jgi:polyhydroxybutyrate depolymerase